MEMLMIAIFVVGYLAIATEHSIHINKTASALLTGVLCWTIFVTANPDATFGNFLHFKSFAKDFVDTPFPQVYDAFVKYELGHHLSKISEIIFFLMGAMTIVELVDAYHGFNIITDKIQARRKVTLLWLISFFTFFLSSILDNLTTALVMVSLLRKLVKSPEERKFFAGMIIIAANAGGAWSPIGDVTTTMLWIGGQITTFNIMKMLFLPSLISLVVPLVVLSFTLKGTIVPPDASATHSEKPKGGGIMLALGVGGLVSVPIFKTLTGLPPYMGILLALGVIWLVSEMLNKDVDDEILKKHLTPMGALSRIDTASVLFFLGILMAIGCLESSHLLGMLAEFMDRTIGNTDVIVIAIGLASAIIDNVPLVAASMGMYDLEVYPTDSKIWEFLAYCAGTGGSILIIGSAAGVAVMGIEKIDFMWYAKKISWIALIGYFAGVVCYLATYGFLTGH